MSGIDLNERTEQEDGADEGGDAENGDAENGEEEGAKLTGPGRGKRKATASMKGSDSAQKKAR